MGIILGNILSPFGIFDWLIWMPPINLIGASSAYLIGKCFKNNLMSFTAGGIVYAIWLAFGVAIMINFWSPFEQIFPFWIQFLFLLVVELILIVGGSPLMLLVDNILGRKT